MLRLNSDRPNEPKSPILNYIFNAQVIHNIHLSTDLPDPGNSFVRRYKSDSDHSVISRGSH